MGSLVFQKVARLQKIDFALKGSISKNPLVKTALDDLERVMGSYLDFGQSGGLAERVNQASLKGL